MDPSEKHVRGIAINDFQSQESFIDRLIEELSIAEKSGKCRSVFYVNGHCINLACENKAFKRVLKDADLRFADGMGLKLAMNNILKEKLNFALTPPVWMHDFFARLEPGSRLYFIGEKPEIVEAYAELAAKQFPDLNIVGHHHGYFLDSPETEEKLIETVNQAAADIVLVGMGMPVQEFFCGRIKNETNAKMVIPVGAYFKRQLGLEKRSPEFVSRIGLEWLHRLILNPGKLFHRCVVGIPVLIFRLLQDRFETFVLE